MLNIIQYSNSFRRLFVLNKNTTKPPKSVKIILSTFPFGLNYITFLCDINTLFLWIKLFLGFMTLCNKLMVGWKINVDIVLLVKVRWNRPPLNSFRSNLLKSLLMLTKTLKYFRIHSFWTLQKFLYIRHLRDQCGFYNSNEFF